MGGCTSPGSGKKETRRDEAGRMNGITLDAGGLIALDRDDRRVIALLVRADKLWHTRYSDGDIACSCHSQPLPSNTPFAIDPKQLPRRT